jgi:hypothetical protein
MFSVSIDGAVLEKDTASHLSPLKLIERYGHLDDVTWAGSGAHAEREFLGEHARQRGLTFSQGAKPVKGWRLSPQVENLARHVAALGLRAFEMGKVQSPQSLSAIYVRPSDPELKEQCR